MKRKVMSWGVLHKGRLVVWRLLGRTGEKERWVQEMSQPTKLEDMEDQVSRQEFRMQARSASLLLTWMSRRTGSEMAVRLATNNLLWLSSFQVSCPGERIASPAQRQIQETRIQIGHNTQLLTQTMTLSSCKELQQQIIRL